MKSHLAKIRIFTGTLAIVGALVLTVGGITLETAASAAQPETSDFGITNTCDPSGNGPNETKTRSEILARAQKWVDIGLTYNAGACQDDGFGRYRRDCSGLVSMAWGLEINLVSDGLAASFMSYAASSNGMYFISRAELQPGDALVKTGHVELFSHWENPGSPGTSAAFVYSFNTTGETVQNPYAFSNFGNRGKNSSSDMAGYRYVRYKNIEADGPMPTGVPGHADVNGDGREDLVAQNEDSVWVKISTGSSFGAPTQWASVPFYGDLGNHIGDINGDGKADLVAQSSTAVWVMTSTGSSFSAPTQWASVPFYGDLGNHIGDINGDGKADLVAQHNAEVWVMTSTGSSFSAPTRWASVPFYGDLADHIGDINGDGKADLVAQSSAGIWVMTSTGSSFSAPTQWASVPFYGDVADHIGDINGDGKADLVAQSSAVVWAMTSTGSSFSAPTQWASVPFYGDVADHIGDINGDGKADLVAQSSAVVWARTSTGSSFSAPTQWASGAFQGSLANHG